MKLKALFREIDAVTWKGSKELEITSMSANSKTVGPGTLFVAKRGKSGDGHRFIAEAVAAGAVAILTDTYDPFLKNITQVIHMDVNGLESLLGHRFYQNPSTKLAVFGVTGTSGKTTTTFLIQHLLQSQHQLCGLVGSVNWMTGTKVLPSSLTTPDLLTLLNLFHEMVKEGCSSVAMEVSSIALDQKRVEGVSFAAAVFTNFTQDHLDYHSTMEEYGAAKARLFTTLAPESIAIINGDDPASTMVVQSCRAPVIRYGLHPSFDLYASNLDLSPCLMKFDVHWKGQRVSFKTHLIGQFNVYNILAATAVALTHGMNLNEVANALASFTGVPGRLERVLNRRGVQVFVDYAHKPDALQNVLQTLAKLKKGRLITVFGCGGSRDPFKRPLMGSIAERLSDLTIVTSDNPRQEEPEEIARQIIRGFQDQKRYIVELDRKKAICAAIALAKPDDIVLVAGKGHEAYQVFAHHTIPFDDRLVIQEACDC